MSHAWISEHFTASRIVECNFKEEDSYKRWFYHVYLRLIIEHNWSIDSEVAPCTVPVCDDLLLYCCELFYLLLNGWRSFLCWRADSLSSLSPSVSWIFNFSQNNLWVLCVIQPQLCDSLNSKDVRAHSQRFDIWRLPACCWTLQILTCRPRQLKQWFRLRESEWEAEGSHEWERTEGDGGSVRIECIIKWDCHSCETKQQ